MSCLRAQTLDLSQQSEMCQRLSISPCGDKKRSYLCLMDVMYYISDCFVIFMLTAVSEFYIMLLTATNIRSLPDKHTNVHLNIKYK